MLPSQKFISQLSNSELAVLAINIKEFEELTGILKHETITEIIQLNKPIFNRVNVDFAVKQIKDEIMNRFIFLSH